MRNQKIKHIDKPWGYEKILETNQGYTVKKLLMKRGHQCSYQYHEKKEKPFIALAEVCISSEMVEIKYCLKVNRLPYILLKSIGCGFD